MLEPQVFDYIDGDMIMFERDPLESFAKDGQLVAYRHEGFWAAVDTPRDKNIPASILGPFGRSKKEYLEEGRGNKKQKTKSQKQACLRK